jgi:hypothetical protein
MAVDVKKAIQAVGKFGCEAGYDSPGMFLVIVPAASDEEMSSVIPVSVHELEWIAGADDETAFKKRLAAVRITELSKVNSAIPRVALRAVT